MLLKPCKLKASSLAESVIAIAIISVCVLVAFVVYVNVVKQNDSVNYYKAEHEVERLTANCRIDNDYENNTYTYKGYKIDKKVTVNDNTAQLNWTITTANKRYTIKKIIPYFSND